MFSLQTKKALYLTKTPFQVKYEIETLQRCATLHSWNSHFWFSLALAYEKAVSCTQPQDGDFNTSFRCKNCLLYQDLTEENCMENPLNGKWQSKEIDIIIKPCCSSNNKVQSTIFAKPCDSEELEITPCLAHLALREQDDPVDIKYSCLPHPTMAGHKTEFQEHSESICCSRTKCSEGLKDDDSSCLFSSCRKHLSEHYCGYAKDKLKWRNHVLAFGCLVKSRFFLEKAVESSSSFAKDKSETLLTEVNAKIAAHTDCGCVKLIDKVLQLLYTSVIASEQAMSDQEQCDTETKPKERKQQENVTTFVSNSMDFEQKWFGDLLSYMAGN